MDFTNLLKYGWIQGAVTLILLKVFLTLLRYFYSRNGNKVNIQKKDNIIEAFVLVVFLGVPFVSQFYFGVTNIFWYALAYAIAGICLEFLFDYIWLRLMGSRLYRYYKANLLGFTSWFIFPYWAGAGLFFYGAWQFLLLLTNGNTSIGSLVINFKDMALVAIITLLATLMLVGLKDFIKGRLSSSKGFRWSKYLILVLTVCLPIIYFVITSVNRELLLVYFVLSSTVGLILEGIMSRALKRVYGESFWLYYRYNLFDHGTSLLILPIWSAAALVALMIFTHFGLV